MHLNSSTVYAYSSRQTKSTKNHAKLYFALEQSKKVLFAMNVSCPTGVNVTQSGLASLMTSGLMFGVYWKKDYLKDRGGPSFGLVGQFRNRRLSIGRTRLKGSRNRYPLRLPVSASLCARSITPQITGRSLRYTEPGLQLLRTRPTSIAQAQLVTMVILGFTPFFRNPFSRDRRNVRLLRERVDSRLGNLGVLRGLATAYTDPTHDLPVHDNQQTALEGYDVRV